VIDPQALKLFLAEAYAQIGTRYVLLVGGDTYDYYDRLALGSISDVPTLYGSTHPVVNHAPLDGLYADIDGDGSPEIAIGRFPVRTESELQSLLDKALSYPQIGIGTVGVFAAERKNVAEGSDYSAEFDQIIENLPSTWQVNAERVYLDDYASGAPGVAAARADLVAAVNQGSALVSYFGHGSPTLWSREQFLQGAQINALLGNSVAPVVTEFGCWGGYFVAPQYNTMSHGWLLAGSEGATAMFASAGLTEHHSDRRMAEVLLGALTQPGVWLGDVMLQAKQGLHASEPELADILRGLTLFGDPTMRMPE
jgi:hypothetical protein